MMKIMSKKLMVMLFFIVMLIAVFCIQSSFCQEHPYTEIFQKAAQEFNIPASLLMALGWEESHWSMHAGQPSIDQAYGIMGLRSRKDFDALRLAAKLIGLEPEKLKLDAEANIYGAASLLRHLANEMLKEGNPSPDDRPDTWENVLIQYSGIPNYSLGLDFSYGIFYYLNFGVNQEADDKNGIVYIPKVFLDFKTIYKYREPMIQAPSIFSTMSQDYPSAFWVPANIN